jgi:hypothetical protein
MGPWRDPGPFPCGGPCWPNLPPPGDRPGDRDGRHHRMQAPAAMHARVADSAGTPGERKGSKTIAVEQSLAGSRIARWMRQFAERKRCAPETREANRPPPTTAGVGPLIAVPSPDRRSEDGPSMPRSPASPANGFGRANWRRAADAGPGPCGTRRRALPQPINRCPKRRSGRQLCAGARESSSCYPNEAKKHWPRLRSCW